MTTNQLYYGDRLELLRNHAPSESVDLIYVAPPSNLFRHEGQIGLKLDLRRRAARYGKHSFVTGRFY
ncbi:MAG: hypothetical protein OXN17_11925 [Candidatus Poribacteria bacterium]|nr:hypothetical protein [Candidatus Poribacteria bacterium]